ncbi:hypothetical protein [Streptomyces capparidis]
MSTGVENGGVETGTAGRLSPPWEPPSAPPARTPPTHDRPTHDRPAHHAPPLPPPPPHAPPRHPHRPAPPQPGRVPPAPADHPPLSHHGPVPPPATSHRSRRPAPPLRSRVAAALCLILGIGLLGGAVIGGTLDGSGRGEEPAAERAARAFDATRELWHNVPVDRLFPRTLDGPNAGPGGADRVWKRLGVAPDGACRLAEAFDPALTQVLAAAGCVRLLRATYTDTTSSSVTTVGLLVTETDQQGMRDLKGRWSREGLATRANLMPRPHPVPGTVAAGFGIAQRASWTVRIREDVPFVVFSVSGFADGRTVADPVPAVEAVREGNTAPPAEAGLGHDAKGVEAQVAERLTEAADATRRQLEQAEGRER